MKSTKTTKPEQEEDYNTIWIKTIKCYSESVSDNGLKVNFI